MPDSVLSLFPNVLNLLELMKTPVKASLDLSGTLSNSYLMGLDSIKNTNELCCNFTRQFLPTENLSNQPSCEYLLELYQKESSNLLSLAEENTKKALDRFQQGRQGDLAFLEMFTEKTEAQDWSTKYSDSDIILDLPGLRLIDISLDVKHKIDNYCVVFAPRAGHHSNIAERVALYMRDNGLTRMAIVEQKCAEDIPLEVDGVRHYENFNGQVDQYRKILANLKERAGVPSHLVAVCQPGPLLISTLILYPELGKTFGSAGSPMDTEGESGMLTDFARSVGEGYIDTLISCFGHVIGDDHPGAGRVTFDGRLQVAGFYLIGMDTHIQNFQKLLMDMRNGDKEAVERQKSFYNWYNYALHSSAGFLRDTFQKIFIKNELINGELVINGKKVDLKNYPKNVPIWALSGKRDDITPIMQSSGHMRYLDSVSSSKKMNLHCNSGHMGLFRSKRVLKDYYSQIIKFLLSNSDKVKK